MDAPLFERCIAEGIRGAQRSWVSLTDECTPANADNNMLLHGSVEVACISGGRRYIADVLVGMMYFASSAPMGERRPLRSSLGASIISRTPIRCDSTPSNRLM